MTLLQPHEPAAPWRTYRILRGEQGVFHYEPYKSILLPLWRFKTLAIARESSTVLWEKYLEYEDCDDFVGMDMCRKFLQMGMTRSKRYGNWRGGRKYDGYGEVKGKSEGVEWEGREEKEEASLVFREVWERVKGREGYLRAKGGFLERQRGWDREEKEREERERKLDVVGKDKDEGDEVALRDSSEDGDHGRGGRGQEERPRKSKSRNKKADERGEVKERGLLRPGIKDGDDIDYGRGQEEGKRRSKRRKRK